MEVFGAVGAAVQLASQLVYSVRSIKSFIGKASRAPSAVRYLYLHCENVIDLAHCLRNDLESLRGYAQPPSSRRYDPERVRIINCRLKICVDIAEEIRISLPKLNKLESDRKILRLVARFQYALKAREMAEVKQQLNDSIILLSLAIRAKEGPVLTILPTETPDTRTPRQNGRINARWSLPERRVPTPKERSIILRIESPAALARGISLGSGTAPPCTSGTVVFYGPQAASLGSCRDDDEPLAGNSVSHGFAELRFTPETRWLSHYILRPLCVMPPEIEGQLKEIFFQRDLGRLKTLLGNKLVSLDSINSEGKPLLMFAQLCLDEQAVIFLAKQGCSVARENVEFCASCPSSSVACFRTLCWHGKDDLRDCYLDDLLREADGIINVPERFEACLFDLMENTTLIPEEVLGSALLVAAIAWAYVVDDISSRHLGEREMADMRMKKHLLETRVKTILDWGATLDYLDQEECSVLGNFILRFHPLDCRAIIADWISLLQSFGIDAASYLNNEAQLFRRTETFLIQRQGSIRRRAVKMLLDSHQGPRVEVAWYIDPDGPAELALREFPGLGDGNDDCCCAAEWHSAKEDCLCSWPFPCSE